MYSSRRETGLMSYGIRRQSAPRDGSRNDLIMRGGISSGRRNVSRDNPFNQLSSNPFNPGTRATTNSARYCGNGGERAVSGEPSSVLSAKYPRTHINRASTSYGCTYSKHEATILSPRSEGAVYCKIFELIARG